MSDESNSINDSKPNQEGHMDNQPFSIDWLNEREMSEKFFPVKMMLYIEKWSGVPESRKRSWLRYATMGSPKRSIIEYIGDDKTGHLKWTVEKEYLEMDGFSATGHLVFTVAGIGNVIEKIRREDDC